MLDDDEDLIKLVQENEDMLLNIQRWERMGELWAGEAARLREDAAVLREEVLSLKRDCDASKRENERLRTTIADSLKKAEATYSPSDEDSTPNGTTACGHVQLPPPHGDGSPRMKEVVNLLERVDRNISVFRASVPKLVTDILPVVHAVKPDTECDLTFALVAIEKMAACLNWVCSSASTAQRFGVGSRDVSPPPLLAPLSGSPPQAPHQRSVERRVLRQPLNLDLPLPPQSLSRLDAELPSPFPSPRSAVDASARNSIMPTRYQQGSAPSRRGPQLLLDDSNEDDQQRLDLHEPSPAMMKKMVPRRNTTPLRVEHAHARGSGTESRNSQRQSYIARSGHKREQEAVSARVLSDISPNHTPPAKRTRTEEAHRRALDDSSDFVRF